jgi:DNA-binding transcriptional LysR family regulator
VRSKETLVRAAEHAPASPPTPIDLNLFLMFAEIVEVGSLSRASETLRIPKSTLSRKLRQLEEQVGAVLLKRGLHTLELTEIGRALLQHCQRIASEATEASSLAAEMQSELRGTMRISLPLGLNNTWITQALARFASQYPQISLAIEVTNRWIDVSEEPYDVALHVGRIRNVSLPARRLANLGRGIYASPAYYARKGVPECPQDLLKHDCIAMETQLVDGIWTFDRSEGGTKVTVTPRMRVTDIVIAREMAAAGVGIAMLTHAVCMTEVREGRLVRALPDWSLPTVPVSATFLERRHLPRRIRAFIDEMAHAIHGQPPGD